MRAIVFIVAIFLFLGLCHHSMANCVREYYDLTNQAELAICDHLLPQAQLLYQKAFALDCELAHERDIGNAFILACKLQKWKQAQHYALQLKSRGVQYDSLAKKIQRSFGKKKGFLEKLKSTTLAAKYHTQEAALAQLLAFDQIPRGDCPGYQKHCVDRVKYIDSIVLVAFKKLIQQEGGWVYNLSHDSRISRTPYYYFFILHSSAWQRYWVHEEMTKALHEGKVPPHVYGELVDRFHDNNKKEEFPHYETGRWYELNGENYLLQVPAEEQALIDKNRASIYLCTLEEQEKKIRFKKEHPDFFLPVHKAIAEIPDERLKALLEDKKIVPLLTP